MDVETLEKIISKLPGDYEVRFKHVDIELPVKDVIEVDVQEKKLVLK